jgi:hypothetical protein
VLKVLQDVEKVVLVGLGRFVEELREVAAGEGKVRPGALNKVVQKAHPSSIVEAFGDWGGINGTSGSICREGTGD